MKEEWEYTEVSVAIHGNSDYLTRNYGSQGWELVAIIPIQSTENNRLMECVFYFKREKKY